MIPAIYINCCHRVDRRFLIEKELTSYDIPFQRFDAIYDPEHGLGCNKSHLGALKLARDKQYPQVLILEDDFTFLISKQEFQDFLTKLATVNYDVCLLSFNIQQSDPIDDTFQKITESTTASGYIVNSHYYNTIIDAFQYAADQFELTNEFWIYVTDVYWKKLQIIHNWIGPVNRIGKQRPGYSDLMGKYVDYEL